MTTRAVGLGALGVSSLALLGGCTTMQGPQRYAYYRVPCTTPGAVVATPIAAQPEVGRTQMPGEPTSHETSTGSGRPTASATPPPVDAAPESGATCVVAVSDAGSRYGRSFYPGYGGYYGRPFYGSFGIGLGFGSRFGGGHGYRGHGFSGGHAGSGHGSHHR